MSELKMISPLLDRMIIEKEYIGHDDRPYYALRNEKDGERYILKTISLPESDSRIRALILSGAYPDEQSVHEYYGRLAEDIRAELNAAQKLAASGAFAGASAYQIEPKESGVGYDIYILYPQNISLSEFLAQNAVTGLRAINLGIDLCDALTALREAGYLYLNLKPENIFLMPGGKFMIGDLGLTDTQYLQYASVPEHYLGTYSAPELSDITACPNLTVDLYALGMVLYRIYNGNHAPFEDESTNAAMSDKLRLTGKPLPSPLYADYELAEIIIKACAFKKEERYQSPEELKQALKLYMQRNEVSDALIVPPIVADLDPLPLIDTEEEDEPIRMTEADELDDTFRRSFAPNLSEDAAAEEAPVVEQPAEAAPEATEETAPIEAPAYEPEAAEAEVTEEVEPEDPDQMDIDHLIASVNEVVGEAEPLDAVVETEEATEEIEPTAEDSETPEEEDSSYIDTEDAYEEEHSEGNERRHRKKSNYVLWGIIAAALLSIALLGYFLLSWYFVQVTELKTISTSPTQIIIEVVSDDNPEHFSVLCTDSFGNDFEAARSGSQYCFTGLREKTSYTISVAAEKYHGFSAAAPVLVETTNEYTVISDVTFDRLNIDGDIRLSFSHKGPVPSQWKLTYCKKDGSDSHTYRFDGESYQINGLELYETYIFTFEDADGTFMSGDKKIEYQVYPRITATDFSITNIEENVVTLSWECGDIWPEKWAISCIADGMDTISLISTETTAEITLPDFSSDYTFTLTAPGMDAPEQILLNANPVIISNFAAAANDDGSLTLTWDTPVGQPEGQWRINYRLKYGFYGYSSASISVTGENSVTLNTLPADAEYEFVLIALDDDGYVNIFGTTAIEATTGNAVPFDGYQILPAAPYGDGTESESLIALWQKPDKDTWDFRDLLSARRTVFNADEKIALCIEIASCDVSTAVANDTVFVTYAVRNADGTVVAAVGNELKWSSVWFERRHTGVVPMPMIAGENSEPTVMTGEFTIEVYINGKLLAAKGFTIEP